MISINSARPIAVVDIDGVIVENPPEAQEKGVAAITDTNYWDRHWKNPEKGKLNEEMCDLVKALASSGWHIVFLTARPSLYRPYTMALLKRAGFNAVHEDMGIVDMSVAPRLVMLPGNSVPVSSAEWKSMYVKGLKDRGNVKLMIEDYKANAEAVRQVVPVLLYERKKQSDYFPTFPCCGGLSRCWCA